MGKDLYREMFEEFHSGMCEEFAGLEEAAHNGSGVKAAMGRVAVDPAWAKLEHDLEEINQAARREYAAYREALRSQGRTKRRGMNAMDHTRTGRFVPFPVKLWTKLQVKNRLKWLRTQRGLLLGKQEMAAELQTNYRKLAKYTKELFSRESAANQAKERVEFNARRRWKRQQMREATTRKVQKQLVNKWFAARKNRKASSRKSAKERQAQKPE